jgi:hypothetical protein
MAVIVIGLAGSSAANEAIGLRQTTGAFNLVGWLLIGYGVLAYVVGLLEHEPVAVPFAGAGVAIGATVILLQAAYPAGFFPVALTAIAVGMYAAQALWWGGGEGSASWASMHRWTGAAILAVTALYGYAIPAYSQPHSVAVLSTVVTIAALAGLLFMDSRLFHRAHGDLLAVLAASFIIGRLATFLDLANVQFHVAGPGLALIAAGRILLRRDRAHLALANLMMAGGSALLLLVTLFQTGGINSTASLYIALLLAEAVVAIGIGIAWRSRVMVVTGGVGAALAALRALFQVAQYVPLFAIFGMVAILILVIAAALALARDRLVQAGASATSVWNQWD